MMKPKSKMRMGKEETNSELNQTNASQMNKSRVATMMSNSPNNVHFEEGLSGRITQGLKHWGASRQTTNLQNQDNVALLEKTVVSTKFGFHNPGQGTIDNFNRTQGGESINDSKKNTDYKKEYYTISIMSRHRWCKCY